MRSSDTANAIRCNETKQNSHTLNQMIKKIDTSTRKKDVPKPRRGGQNMTAIDSTHLATKILVQIASAIQNLLFRISVDTVVSK